MPGLWYSVPLTPQQATVDPCLCQRLLDTHRQVWLSLLWGRCFFLLGPMYKVFLVPSKSLFPQSCGSSVIKSHWPSKANSLGVLSPLPDPQVGKSVVGPRTFATVQELLWYNYSPFCGLSAGWLYGEAHMPWLPGLLQPEPCPHSRPLLTCASIEDTQTLRGRSGSVSCGIPGSWCTQGFICAL